MLMKQNQLHWAAVFPRLTLLKIDSETATTGWKEENTSVVVIVIQKAV